MVFRKPYGFLIKHFKLIHLILTGLFIYLSIKVNGIFRYYNNFIAGTVSKLDARQYISNFYLIAIVISIIICFIVYALMRYKKKPRALYLILILFCIVNVVMIQVAYGGLDTIYISVLETKTLRLYRDLLRILTWVQYVFVVIVLIRGLGFDIKKFNFVQDLAELNIDVSDEEEVELTFGSTNALQRKVHRGFREFKYYYLENKIFIQIILVILVVGLGSFFFIRKEVVYKEYQQNEYFSSDNFNFKVLNTYVTNKSYNGSYITKTDTSFVVVRVNLSSNNGKRVFNTSNFVLYIGQHHYTSEKRYAASFVDLGNSYKGQVIDRENTYLFIFNVKNEDLKKKMKIVYASDKTVHLKAVYLDEVQEPVVYKLKDKIDLSKSSLGSGYFQIQSYEIKDSFDYSYDYEIKGEKFTGNLAITSTQNTILHLVMDTSYPYQLTNYGILSDYAKLYYKIGEDEYSTDVFGDKTPGDYKEGLYLIVDKEIVNASDIWFLIRIRNQQYVYTLK